MNSEEWLEKKKGEAKRRALQRISDNERWDTSDVARNIPHATAEVLWEEDLIYVHHFMFDGMDFERVRLTDAGRAALQESSDG